MKQIKLIINDDCIGCDTCTTIAPKQFALTKNQMEAIIIEQPNHEESIIKCLDAMKKCPVNAIKTR